MAGARFGAWGAKVDDDGLGDGGKPHRNALLTAIVHLAMALFLTVFLTEFDRELVRRGLMPVPGVVAFFFGVAWVLGIYVGAGAVKAIAGIASRPSVDGAPADGGFHRRSMAGWHLAGLAQWWPFWLAFLLAALICVGQSFRGPAISLRETTRIGIALAVCAALALLAMIPHLRRCWRGYLGVALVVYCASVWFEAWLPGTFSDPPWRVAGFGMNANHGTYAISMLAAASLDYRRPTLGGFGVLLLAGVTVFLTLSRGGLVAYLALAGGYCLWVGWHVRSWRAGGALAAALAGLVTLGGWLSVQMLPVFEDRYAADRLQVTLNPSRWFVVESHNRGQVYDSWMRIVNTRYGSFGRVLDEHASSSVSTRELFSSELTGREPIYWDMPRVCRGQQCVGPRFIRMRNTWDAIVASPWLGHGSGFNVGKGIETHNMFLGAWVDYGIGGALAYCALLATAWWAFWRRRFWPGVFLVSLVLVWSGVSHNVLDGRPVPMLLGLLIGLAASERRDPGEYPRRRVHRLRDVPNPAPCAGGCPERFLIGQYFPNRAMVCAPVAKSCFKP